MCIHIGNHEKANFSYPVIICPTYEKAREEIKINIIPGYTKIILGLDTSLDSIKLMRYCVFHYSGKFYLHSIEDSFVADEIRRILTDNNWIEIFP